MKNILFILLLVVSVGVLTAQEESRYEVKNLDTVNTKYSDFGTSFYGDNTVIFASSRKGEKSRKKWSGNHQPYLELYKGTTASDGEIIDVDYFSKSLNTKYHESNAVFTEDLGTVYFSRNNYLNKKFRKDSKGWNLIQLYKATVGEDGDWTDIQAMPFNSDEYQTGHPSLNSDETKLYFTSDMPGGLGLTDIWVVDINGDGSYGTPVNLGPTINSAAKEMFPYISSTGRLFYSSEKAGGNGGLDVYVSKLDSGDSFGESENLGAPLNSTMDDFSFIIDEDSHTGYFSSNRRDGKGDDDIYYFTEAPEKEEEVIPEPCYQVAEGEVRDSKTNALLPGALVVLSNAETGEEIEKAIVGNDATFSFKVDCETSYKVVGSKKNYSIDTKTFTTTDVAKLNLALDLGIDLNLHIVQEFEGDEVLKIKINPIYFDLDKSYIRPDAARELDKVVAIMHKYPNMVVQGGSHTDSRSSHKYNWDLSNRRAAATLKYIVDHGIERERISARGYGETQLTNRCSDGIRCSEAEHQRNRRTEFIVIRKE